MALILWISYKVQIVIMKCQKTQATIFENTIRQSWNEPFEFKTGTYIELKPYQSIPKYAFKIDELSSSFWAMLFLSTTSDKKSSLFELCIKLTGFGRFYAIFIRSPSPIIGQGLRAKARACSSSTILKVKQNKRKANTSTRQKNKNWPQSFGQK